MAKDGGKDDPSHLKDIPRERSGERPDYSQPLPRKPLPKAMQDGIDKAENDSWSLLYDGTASESTDTNLRYAAYASRIRTILLSAHRYVAYTSDIGESFRPIAHPYMIKGAYAVSWLYLAGDVSYEGYKAYIKNQRILNPAKYAEEKNKDVGATALIVSKFKNAADEAQSVLTPSNAGALVPGRVAAIDDYRTVMAQRAVFQGLASMGLPAFTIHSIVRYSGRALKNVKYPKIRTWGPIGLGLAAVPALPYIFDEPVEAATEWVFHKTFELVGGPEAVGHTPLTGRQALLQVEARKESAKEKEL